MKKTLLFAGILSCLLITACDNNNSTPGTHKHEDGSTHSDHAQDTATPAQQEFTVGDTTHKDSSANNEHTHKNGEKHDH
ncbi:MAG TPA: hypothetical protein VGB46_01540 [Flavisolibacter sp.]|jgi:hypothetical protein